MCVFTEPYGVVLIIAPWNYPLLLLLNPLVSLCTITLSARFHVAAHACSEIPVACSEIPGDTFCSHFDGQCSRHCALQDSCSPLPLLLLLLKAYVRQPAFVHAINTRARTHLVFILQIRCICTLIIAPWDCPECADKLLCLGA